MPNSEYVLTKLKYCQNDRQRSSDDMRQAGQEGNDDNNRDILWRIKFGYV